MPQEDQHKNRQLIIRFDGDDLENRSVPIYDLANTLISIQRIIKE